MKDKGLGGKGGAGGEICGLHEGVSVHLLMSCLVCHCMTDRNLLFKNTNSVFA